MKSWIRLASNVECFWWIRLLIAVGDTLGKSSISRRSRSAKSISSLIWMISPSLTGIYFPGMAAPRSPNVAHDALHLRGGIVRLGSRSH